MQNFEVTSTLPVFFGIALLIIILLLIVKHYFLLNVGAREIAIKERRYSSRGAKARLAPDQVSD